MSEFELALRQARDAEAARNDALFSTDDTRALRLAALQEAILASLSKFDPAGKFLELKMERGLEPRLWVDLATHVDMRPDPKTYQLIREGKDSRETLFETPSLDEMKDQILRGTAHRSLLNQMALGKNPGFHGPYDLKQALYIWLMGLAFGVFGLLAFALAFGYLPVPK